jgi:tetratricopeptide (TPR) repeat protein
MENCVSIPENLKHRVSILAATLAPTKSSQKPQFTADADHFGFSWLAPLDTFAEKTIKSHSYIDVLHKDPVFYNPGSYSLMASCYDVEPYQSNVFGLEPLSWDYNSIREKRMHELSKQLTVRAVELCRDKEYKTAMDVLQAALEQWPQNVEAIVTSGACNANLGNLDIAVYQFEHALKLDPGNINARKYLEHTKTKLESIVLPQVSSTTQPGSDAGATTASLRSRDTLLEDGEEVGDGYSGGDGSGRSKKRRKERHIEYESGEDSGRRHSSNKKKSKKSKKKTSKKDKKSKKSSSSRSSKKDTSRSSSSDSSSSEEDGKDEEEWHPILSRNKHKLWNM